MKHSETAHVKSGAGEAAGLYYKNDSNVMLNNWSKTCLVPYIKGSRLYLEHFLFSFFNESQCLPNVEVLNFGFHFSPGLNASQFRFNPVNV